MEFEYNCKFAGSKDCMCDACRSIRKALEEADKIDAEKIFADAEKIFAEAEKAFEKVDSSEAIQKQEKI